MKHKKINIDVYNAVTYVTADVDEAIRLSWAKLKYAVTPDEFEDANGMNIYGGSISIIWLPEGANAGTIAHECAHAALNLFNHKGVAVDLNNQEPTTYLIGFLVRSVTAAIHKLWGVE